MVMSILAGCPPGVNLVCNGFKDEEYMELVLRCRQLGINAMVVMEQFRWVGAVVLCGDGGCPVGYCQPDWLACLPAVPDATRPGTM